MIVTFHKETCHVPPIDLTIPDTNYLDLQHHLHTHKQNANIQHLAIDSIDRGVHDWHAFWIALQRAFPSIQALTFQQNYPLRQGPWKTANTFFQQSTLNYLCIDWYQSFDNFHSSKNVSIQHTIQDQHIVMF